MTTYGYARVSTAKQHASLVTQREALHAKGIEDRHIVPTCAVAQRSLARSSTPWPALSVRVT